MDNNSYNSYGPQEEPKKKRADKKRGIAGYFFSGLSGVLVGALLVWFLIPSVVTNLPTSNKTESTSNVTETQQVSVDVTTDVTSAVEKAADSVVGITNIQSVTDFWNQCRNDPRSWNRIRCYL